MQKPVVIANWKMNPPTFAEAKALFEATKRVADKSRQTSIIIAPPLLYARELRKGYRGKSISFAAQNLHTGEGGAFTGEMSFLQAKDSGITHAIIGHAERRGRGETNEDVRLKVREALACGITPILCVGEVARTISGDYYNEVRIQLQSAFADVVPTKLSKVLIVYEPTWAIGKQTAMSPHLMHEMAIFIRKTIVEKYGEAGFNVRVLYGGSVDEKSVGAMLREGDVSGFLVGRASWHGETLAALVYALHHQEV